MSITITCDWCGKDIDDRSKWQTLSTDAKGGLEEAVGGYVGHYHSSELRSCFDEMREAISMIHEFAPAVGRIPVASGQKIAALRRKHVRPDVDKP